AFTAMFTAIDQTTKTNNKVQAMVDYFTQAKAEDKIFAVSILIGNKPKRPVKTAELKEWAAELAGLPMWLFAESYDSGGDVGEASAMMRRPQEEERQFTLKDALALLSRLTDLPTHEKKAFIIDYWMSVATEERFVFNK